MQNNQNKYFIGIDLGGRKKPTTGICILEIRTKKSKVGSETVEGVKIETCEALRYSLLFKKVKSYLENTEVIAVDGPLTLGKGKGLMRLYEKFLSTKIFRQERVAPLPPALMPELSLVGQDLVKRLEKYGFVLNKNLIETFPTLVRKLYRDEFFITPSFPFPLTKGEIERGFSEHEKSALVCALVAHWHWRFKTRWLGYKDGFLFLPEMSLWRKEWREKFYSAWMNRPRLKYHYLITNIFNK